ncbi:hypothetical protein ASF48_07030 [Rathayibacter sp. Leaf299]|uniref:hypothetical protein n=1 Tax=Rathayibacter sp. Leaf299 TaxID=1736328 RepID=UPI0006FE39F8|nr:hypothetical protein [Rathayibacter sp. Leaf299]KQQ22884.1 hypothetical protein ASF48_07030 [Rathayibacter sp. Leaf299]
MTAPYSFRLIFRLDEVHRRYMMYLDQVTKDEDAALRRELQLFECLSKMEMLHKQLGEQLARERSQVTLSA